MLHWKGPIRAIQAGACKGLQNLILHHKDFVRAKTRQKPVGAINIYEPAKAMSL